MSGLTRQSRGIIVGVLGIAAIVWLAVTADGILGPLDWVVVLALSAAAIVAQSVLRRPDDRDSGFLLAAPVFAAFILFPAPVAAFVAIASSSALIIRRPDTGAAAMLQAAGWSIALAAAVIAVSVETRAGGAAASENVLLLTEALALIGGRNLVLSFLAGRWFGDESSMQSARTRILIEGALISAGWALAMAWKVGPLHGLVAAVPVVLAYLSAHAITARRDSEDNPLGIVTDAQFRIALKQAMERAQAAGSPVSVVRCDVDQLLQINRVYGRGAGDAVLQMVAQRIARGHRTADLVSRSSEDDDEYAVLLPNTDETGALRVAERFRAGIEQTPVALPDRPGPIVATISVGVATYTGAGPVGDLMEDADLALFQAKLAGRNQTTSYSPAIRQIGVDWARRQQIAPRDRVGVVLDRGAAGPQPPRVAPPTAPTASEAPAAALAPEVGAAVDGVVARVAAVASPTPAHAESPAVAPSAAPSRPPDQHPVILGFIATLLVVGLGITAADIATTSAPIPWGALGLFAILILMAEQYAVDIEGRGKTSITVIPVIGGGLVAGGIGSLVVALTFAGMAKIRAKSPVHRALFNFAVALLSAEAARHAFLWIGGGTIASLPIEQTIVPSLVAGLAYYVVNHAPLMFVLGFIQKRSAWEIWRTNYQWLWPHYLVMGVLGVILGLSYLTFGWFGALAFMAPAAMMHLAIKQYVDRTSANIRQLWELNQQLQEEIGQRKAAEDENARLAQEAARVAALEELNRLKTEFISIASHELRTPMTAIVGFSDLMLERETSSEDQKRWIYLINREAGNLSSLIDNLLDVSRIESGRVALEAVPVALDELVDGVLIPIRAGSPNHIFAVEIAPNAGRVRADVGKLNQIFTNLISNAVKYSPAGGQITIAARRVKDQELEVSIQDQGIGIAPDQLGRVFERFQRISTAATRNIRGSGLGLYIVKQLVELHGGRISVESEVGRGSTFRFTLTPDSAGAQTLSAEPAAT
ncbi:MAG: diguanylate cyclase [Chloroflexota bacterium]|nr:MAG: diguanylate cyclase [Chloroflexota bacterium]